MSADGVACDRLFVGLVWGAADRAFEAPAWRADAVDQRSAAAAASAAVDRLEALYAASITAIGEALDAYAAAWAASARPSADGGTRVEPRDLQAIARVLFHGTGPDGPAETVLEPGLVEDLAALGMTESAAGLLSNATYPFLALKPRYRRGATIFDPSKDVRLSAYYGVDVTRPALLRARLIRGLSELLSAPRGGDPNRAEDEPLRVFVGLSRTHIPLRYAFAEAAIVDRLRARVGDDAAALRRARSDLKYVFPSPDLVDIDDRFLDGSYRAPSARAASYRFLPTAVDSEISERDAAFLSAWKARERSAPRHNPDVGAPAAREIVKPLTPFRAKRIDYAVSRIEHYTGLGAGLVQPYVFFTNYPFYMKAFIREVFDRHVAAGRGRLVLPLEGCGPEGVSIRAAPPDALRDGDGRLDVDRASRFAERQMPAIHFAPDDPTTPGVSIVNIGVGPSNAKTMCDLIASLAPKAWLMLGHCGGLRVTQEIGQFVLAQAYVRDDHVLDESLPLYAPIPQVTEVQECLMRGIEDELLAEDATGAQRFSSYALHRRRMLWILRRFGVEIPDPTRLRFEPDRVATRAELAEAQALKEAGLVLDPAADPTLSVAADGETIAAQYRAWRAELRARVRTGTVLTTDDRNWELRPQEQMVERFERSRAIAVDMESATIAGAGLRYRIPYGALLCVSDKPLMGEPKMRGQADEFYETATRNHVKIGLAAVEHLARRADELSASRKLAGLDDPPIL